MGFLVVLIIAALLVLAAWIGHMYQRLQSLGDAAREAWTDLEGILDRRRDLLGHAGALGGGPEGLEEILDTGAAAAGNPGPPERAAREEKVDRLLPALLERLEEAAGPDPEELRDEIEATRLRLPYATQRYETALARYDDALRSFPTVLVARVCRFRSLSAYRS